MERELYVALQAAQAMDRELYVALQAAHYGSLARQGIA